MESSIVNALKKIGQMDCTAHRVTTVVLGLLSVFTFMWSYRRVQLNPKADALTPDKLIFMGSGLLVTMCFVTFLVLSTDWGCAMVAIRNASRLV